MVNAAHIQCLQNANNVIVGKCTRRPREYTLNNFARTESIRRNKKRKREREREKTQRMFRLIYMQILQGWKRKQFTHQHKHKHKHKYTYESKTSSRSCNFEMVQIEIDSFSKTLTNDHNFVATLDIVLL